MLLATNIAKLSDLLAIVFVAEQVVFDTDGISGGFFEKVNFEKNLQTTKIIQHAELINKQQLKLSSTLRAMKPVLQHLTMGRDIMRNPNLC